jgi:hypothetical protein
VFFVSIAAVIIFLRSHAIETSLEPERDEDEIYDKKAEKNDIQNKTTRARKGR